MTPRAHKLWAFRYSVQSTLFKTGKHLSKEDLQAVSDKLSALEFANFEAEAIHCTGI